MDYTIEPIRALSLLTDDIKDEVSSMSTRISFLENERNRIDETWELNTSSKAKQERNNDNNDICNEHVNSNCENNYIVALETERLRIVSDLEYQDYVGEKLANLIEDNDAFLNSIQGYLSRKDQMRYSDKKIFEDKQEIQRKCLKGSLSTIESSIHNIMTKTQEIESQFSSLLSDIKNDIKVLESTSASEISDSISEVLDAL